MASIESQDKKRICGTNKDMVSNMPDTVTEKILKLLPVSMAVNMGAVSRLWRQNWLAHPYLVFRYDDFWERHNLDWERGSSTISGILFLHHGPIRTFRLFIPFTGDNKNLILGQWLSFLSRSCVKKIALKNAFKDPNNLDIVPSYIFHCRELVKLDLCSFTLNPPPSNFQGFAHLKRLKLSFVTIKQKMLSSLITNCPCLVFLKIDRCDVRHLAIDAPCLEELFITGYSCLFQTLCLKNVPRLTKVSFSLCTLLCDNVSDAAIATFKSLSSSCKLQSLTLDDDYCKLLAKAGIRKSLPKEFNHLHRLCFMRLNLSNSNVFCCTLGMLQSCPCIKDLEISLDSTGSTSQHVKFQYDRESCKLPCLLKVTITDIVGLDAELKLVEYLLDVSVLLEKLFIKFGEVDANSKLKVLSELMRFPRASAKAQLVRLD